MSLNNSTLDHQLFASETYGQGCGWIGDRPNVKLSEGGQYRQQECLSRCNRTPGCNGTIYTAGNPNRCLFMDKDFVNTYNGQPKDNRYIHHDTDCLMYPQCGWVGDRENVQLTEGGRYNQSDCLIQCRKTTGCKGTLFLANDPQRCLFMDKDYGEAYGGQQGDNNQIHYDRGCDPEGKPLIPHLPQVKPGPPRPSDDDDDDLDEEDEERVTAKPPPDHTERHYPYHNPRCGDQWWPHWCWRNCGSPYGYLHLCWRDPKKTCNRDSDREYEKCSGACGGWYGTPW
ncbi:hypothetical protein NLG97_g9500 [Lecanicillium saksenae]|uniref:Uncharacterized protein n=1 Tax=Lecanicillium saksenae TaxID=468837 RepID=A0ACC1QIK4_9HYPO|nr:hypothetical protein NLG97_g9500 [Lecanicillium saksenae]